MFAARSLTCRAPTIRPWMQIRSVSTLEGHPYIYVFPANGNHILSLLPSEPTDHSNSIGVTSKLPPTTDSFKENPEFIQTLQNVVSKYAHLDPDAIGQAQVMVSTAGANLSSGGVLLTGARSRRRQRSADSSGGASGQGGAGSGGRGGWIHISDNRRPPDYGRIAWPEDIFGSLEVDSDGSFVGENGNYQPSGTYRVITRDGILGLSPFLREKLVQRLREQESK
ncbi:hypothetical protein FE257_002947 [Aspergillus nanangensis]|uniref:Uncharacterized protein n=1 Tax=Aspergillus nanangensis TaxID=2582783 RepID=A0AAD4CT59_ASPNN|nr:hypothetical protein FE257_002947 [Aspergillus nanangensis]